MITLCITYTDADVEKLIREHSIKVHGLTNPVIRREWDDSAGPRKEVLVYRAHEVRGT